MAKTIWCSKAQQNYFGGMSVEELAKEYENWTDEEEVDNIPLNLVGRDSSLDSLLEEKLLNHLLYDGDGGDQEDLKYNILPELAKQCYKDIIVFAGNVANWDGHREGCKAMDIDDAFEMFYPDYDSTSELIVDNGNLLFGESSHDAPMGFTLGLYSFKTKEDYDNAERELLKMDEDFEMGYFFDCYNYEEIEMLIEKGILTPIKNTINNYTGNEKEEQ